MTLMSSQSIVNQHPNTIGPVVVTPSVLGWLQPRRVAYIHRHAQLPDQCLYFWNHQDSVPEAAIAQQMVFLLEDIYVETRGEFKAQKLILDTDLGPEGKLRLIVGFKTTCAFGLLSSLCALSPDLLSGPITLRLRTGTSNGVVLPSLYVDNEWVDGRPLTRDDRGDIIPALDLLAEVQTLLRHGLSVEMLPHQYRAARQTKS
jgi:hypothetical protein